MLATDGDKFEEAIRTCFRDVDATCYNFSLMSLTICLLVIEYFLSMIIFTRVMAQFLLAIGTGTVLLFVNCRSYTINQAYTFTLKSLKPV